MTQPCGTRIAVLGEVAVLSGGTAVPLPASRKTRALLGYLAMSRRPVRRERLCELLWDLPDDPRGALRWSLSKLRQVLGDDPSAQLKADRERVELVVEDAAVDLLCVRAQLTDGATIMLPRDQLQNYCDLLAQPVLDGLAGVGDDAFDHWLQAEREDARLLYLRALRRMTLHPDNEPAEALRWARIWQNADPLSVRPNRAVASILADMGRRDEADAVVNAFTHSAKEAGIEIDGPLIVEKPEITPDFVRSAETEAAPEKRRLRSQQIRFCKARDGTRIAYATVGDGLPLVKAANWLNHLELDWNSPIWGPTFDACAEGRTFIRYDERGNGLSDWEVDDISFEAFVQDLECVVDEMGLDRFPLLGISQGCAVSIEYAVRHPERVSGLILVSGYPSGWRIGCSRDEQLRRQAVLELTRHGWGTDNPAYRHVFSQTFMPDSIPEDLAWFDEFQRQCTSPENAVRFQEAFGTIDVRHRLAEVSVPTIVFHASGDQRIALEQGRELAIGIPGAEFVPLDGRNHILLGHEPAWKVWRSRYRAFLDEHGI